MPTLTGAEADCLKRLAALFEAGDRVWRGDRGWEALGLGADNFDQVLSLLEHHGAITDAGHNRASRFRHFTITPAAVGMARELAAQEEKAKERKDIVEIVRLTLRKHPVTAWAVIIGGALLFLVTALNQVVSLLKNLGAF